MKEKVLLIYGGKSVEHDISIITALQVMNALPEDYEFEFAYIDKKGIWWTAENLKDVKIYSNFEKLASKKRQLSFLLGENILLVKKKNKFVFKDKILSVLNCCHGNVGEDGAVQGMLKTCGIAHTSAGVLSSALCMDKSFMKDILKANEISSPEYIYFTKENYNKSKLLKKIKLPFIVKPANLGSSIAISVCKDEKDIDDAISLAFEFDQKILVEKLVENLKEFNCACFVYRQECFVSNVNEVTNKGEIFSFEDKYLSSSSSTHEVAQSLAKKIKNLTEKVYRLFDCEGIVRVDFLYDEKLEKLFVNEINSIPGSLSFYLFKDIPFKELIRANIEQSLERMQEREKLVVSFESSALENFENVNVGFKK